MVRKILHPRASLAFITLVSLILAPTYVIGSFQIPNITHWTTQSSTEYFGNSKLKQQTSLAYMQLNKMWNRIYNRSMYDIGYSIIECQDGGLAMTGATQQTSMEMSHRYNLWLMRTDPFGNVLWNVSFGQVGYDGGYDLVECPDGGFAVVGYSMNNQSDVSEIFVVRTNALGILLWNKTYSGTASDLGYSIIRVRAGGFAVLASLMFRETCLLRIDEEGFLLWNQSFPVPSIRTNKGLVECPDGGFAFIANNDPFLWANVGLFRTDANGRMLWNRTYGGGGTYSGRGLVLCYDGGFAFVGGICPVGTDNWDIWLVRTDAQGTLLWNQSFGSSEYEIAYSLTQIHGGGFASTGIITTVEGLHNIRLVITDELGDALLDQIIVCDNNCRAHSIIECMDRGLAITGGTDEGDTGMNLILFRIPGNQYLILADRIAWISIVLVLPLVTTVLVGGITVHYLRSKRRKPIAEVH